MEVADFETSQLCAREPKPGPNPLKTLRAGCKRQSGLTGRVHAMVVHLVGELWPGR